MTPLHNIQKDRGCTVGPGCVGGECSCRRTVRLVLEGLREPTYAMIVTGCARIEDTDLEDVKDDDPSLFWGQPWRLCAIATFEGMIDTALKEVG